MPLFFNYSLDQVNRCTFIMVIQIWFIWCLLWLPICFPSSSFRQGSYIISHWKEKSRKLAYVWTGGNKCVQKKIKKTRHRKRYLRSFFFFTRHIYEERENTCFRITVLTIRVFIFFFVILCLKYFIKFETFCI